MSLEGAGRQKSEQLELPLGGKGEALMARRSVEAPTATHEEERSRTDRLMELVVEESNVRTAVRRVRQNKGSPGIDGMKVEELARHLEGNWQRLREELLAGTYQPQTVKRVEIPKPGGGIRQLGIPTVADREGRRWVADVDLEQFFDRVNHDILMSRLAKRITDKRMLRLIRRYLEAGVMLNGVAVQRWEGTPQGGPLSPLLANVLLDEVDKELEKRGHAFVRYADDGNVYVRSERAAKDVMGTLRRLYAKLRLRVNESKSRITRATQSQYLGYGFWVAVGREVRIRVGTKALKTMKERVRQITSRNRGRSLEQVGKELGQYLPGWKNYFQLAQTPGVFIQLDEWVGRRVRMVRLKQWKRGKTVYRELRVLGVSQRAAASVAASTRSWWKMAGTSALNVALPNSHLKALGVVRLADA